MTILTTEFFKHIMDDHFKADDVFSQLVPWSEIRTPTTKDRFLSLEESKTLIDYLSNEPFYPCEYLSQGLFRLLLNLHNQKIYLSTEYIEQMFECSDMNIAAICYAHTTSENIKIYLKMKWIEYYF